MYSHNIDQRIKPLHKSELACLSVCSWVKILRSFFFWWSNSKRSDEFNIFQLIWINWIKLDQDFYTWTGYESCTRHTRLCPFNLHMTASTSNSTVWQDTLTGDLEETICERTNTNLSVLYLYYICTRTLTITITECVQPTGDYFTITSFFWLFRKQWEVIARMAPKMAPKVTNQSSITSMGFPLLQKTVEICVGRQIHVLGSYWTGRMSNEEDNSLYKCTVYEYHAFHKWDTGGTPSQAMELQEMGVDGQGSRETGGSAADRIFFMKYPLPFLQHWYATYPPPHQDTTTTGSSVVSPSSVGGDTDMVCERTSGMTASTFKCNIKKQNRLFQPYRGIGRRWVN